MTVFRENQPSRTPPQKWVWGLGLFALALGLGNLAKAILALDTAAMLPELPMTTTWNYLAVTGGIWGILWILCALGLLRFRPWGRWATLAAATVFQIHVWANHLLFDATDYALQTRPRDLVVTLLFLALIWGGLNRPAVRQLFKPNEE